MRRELRTPAIPSSAIRLAMPAASARGSKPPSTKARTGHAKKGLHPLPRKRVPVAAQINDGGLVGTSRRGLLGPNIGPSPGVNWC